MLARPLLHRGLAERWASGITLEASLPRPPLRFALGACRAAGPACTTLDHSPVCRGRFLLPSQYAMVMFEQPPVAGCSGAAYLQMHLTAAPVSCVLNSPNYEALLSFTKVCSFRPVHACACVVCSRALIVRPSQASSRQASMP